MRHVLLFTDQSLELTEELYRGTSAWTVALPILAVGERVVLFVNHATFPFTGAVCWATGVLRVAEAGDGPAYVLRHARQPVAIAASNLVVRPEVRQSSSLM